MKNRKRKSPSEKKESEKLESLVPKVEYLLPESGNLLPKLTSICENLFYMSETDAEITPFFGEKAEAVTPEIVLKQTGNLLETPFEIREIGEFFKRLTDIKDWFGDEEKATAQKFKDLQEVLTNQLKDAKIIKIGKIQVDIFMIGLDAESRLVGVKTKAVET